MNDALYHADGVHLNKSGTRKIVTNLGLVFKEKSYSNIVTSGIARKSPVHKLPRSTARHA